MHADAMAPLQVIWDYMHLNTPLAKSDCIVGFGNFNGDIARRAAQLYHEGWAPRVLFTGGLGRNTLGRMTQTEAERFAAIAMAEGVPESALLLETQSTNTAENILFTRQLLEEAGIRPTRLLGVHQPFMERRIWAAFGIHWPQAELLVTSPQVTIPEYLASAAAQGLPEQDAVAVMVGDFQRMKLYAEKGYQIPQEIPADAWAAFEALVEMGYGTQLA